MERGSSCTTARLAVAEERHFLHINGLTRTQTMLPLDSAKILPPSLILLPTRVRFLTPERRGVADISSFNPHDPAPGDKAVPLP